ncbi:MAG: hypothetical protein HUJ25_08385 [Crocinitomicaceae bacterium]|nr:hypothetical protein [Crocinitomicaceae bacterium]
MKLFFYLLTLGTLTANTAFSQNFEIDSSEDEEKTKEAVLAWADSVFYMHKEWKFENFRPFYTEEYEIAFLRANAYKDRVEDLEKEKESGRYKGSDEEYEKEHKELQEAYLKIKEELENIQIRVTHFQIHFWSNIQTTDGITVYYEHIVKLDHNFNVTEAVINSAIGKKNEKTEILYKKDVKEKKK